MEKNLIEGRSLQSDFELDAMEGWEEVDYDLSLLSKVDRHLLPQKSYTSFIYLIGVSVIVVTVFITLFLSDYWQGESRNALKPSSVKAEMLTIEKSDVMLPPSIQKMNLAPKENQVETKVMVKEFSKMDKDLRENRKSVIVNSLPTKKITERQVDIISKRVFTKEIYLDEFKLIDYSIIRTSPTVEVKLITLTGTPANMENEESEVVDSEWRTVDIPYNNYIEKSFRILNKGNFKKALSRFETTLLSYPKDINAQFYKGFCLFNLGEYELSANSFQTCLEHEYTNFDEEAQWLIAQSYFLSGNHVLANTIFKQIIDQKGFYAKQAKSKLAK